MLNKETITKIIYKWISQNNTRLYITKSYFLFPRQDLTCHYCSATLLSVLELRDLNS